MDLKIKKNKQSYTINDIYRSYVKTNNSNVDYLRFKTILNEFNKILLESLQDRSEGFKMPFGLGYIQIVKYKPKNISKYSTDYKSSKEIGKHILHLNEHSNGYKYRLFWSKIPQTIPARYKYTLSFVRAKKRRLAKLIFNRQDYINVDDIQIYKM